MVLEKQRMKHSSLPVCISSTEWGHLMTNKKDISGIVFSLSRITDCCCFTLSFEELADAWDLTKKLSKEDTIKGTSIEKVSIKWKVIFTKTGNWGKDTNPCFLGKIVQFGTYTFKRRFWSYSTQKSRLLKVSFTPWTKHL